MRIERVVETCLYVRDVQRSARWYEDVLGLKRFAGTPPRDAFLAAGDSALLLFNAEETLKPADVPAHGARGPQHVAFGVDDIEAWRARLKEKGVKVSADASWGKGRSLYFTDPDGHVVELVTRGTWPMW
jgi:catechol 2,3-dioxygenase-like lactoylglutathione lyase family enzyme